MAGMLLVSPAAAEDWPVGTTIDPAMVVDITPEGFDSVALLIPALLPAEIVIPDTSQEVVDIWICSEDFAMSGGWVDVQVVSADMTPGDGVLNVNISLFVSVNSAADPFDLSFSGCLDMSCPGYVDAFPVDVSTTIALSIVPGAEGTPTLDATVGTVNVSYDLQNDDIHLDCIVGDIEEVLGYVGLSIYDLIIDQFAGSIDDLIADFGPEIETTLEEAFAGASISQEVDLNGILATVSLYPSAISIEPSGVRLVMAGAMSGDAASCIAEMDPNGSLRTDSEAPEIGGAPSGIPTPYHLQVGITDDFVNQALYTLWRGGLLCYTVEPGGAIPLDTSLLNGLSGNAFVDLFPESQPVTLRTRPKAAPTANYTGTNDIDVNLNDLDVEFFAELDGRSARVLDVAINGTAGANLALDGATGNLAIEVALDPAYLIPTVVYNEHVPDATASIEASFGETFGAMIETMIGGLIPDLAFALPSMYGVGLQDLETAATGPSEDWLGAYAWIGSVTYGTGDCSSGCGGDTSGCSGGCNTSSGLPQAVALLGLALLVRRRP